MTPGQQARRKRLKERRRAAEKNAQRFGIPYERAKQLGVIAVNSPAVRVDDTIHVIAHLESEQESEIVRTLVTELAGEEGSRG